MNSDISICCLFQKYGYTHLSAGELLRDERKNPDSQYGELIEKYIKEGKIVPVEITISLLRREMDQTMAANAQKNKFLIDGFPRNQDNVQGWNKTMDGKADVSFVLFFDCNNEVMNIFICPHGLQAIDCQLLEKNGKFTFSVGSNIYI